MDGRSTILSFTFNNHFISSPNRQWKKKSKKKNGTEIKITVKTVVQSKSVNIKTEQRATHTPNKHKSHVVKKGTGSDKWRRLNWISWLVCVCVCVCVGWSLCSSREIHQDLPHIHTNTCTHALTHSHTHTHTYIKKPVKASSPLQ